MRYLLLSVLVVCVIGIMIPSTFASHELWHTQWGSIGTDPAVLKLPYGAWDNMSYELITITGTVTEPGSDRLVHITVIEPDGKTSKDMVAIFNPKSSKNWSVPFQICCNNIGTYLISAEYEGHSLGTGTFEVVGGKAGWLTEMAEGRMVQNTDGGSTFLKLNSLDNTFIVSSLTQRADVIYSGQLLTGDRKSYIPNAEIKLVFTGFTLDGENHYETTTNMQGEFSFRVSMPVGEGYGVQAVYGGSRDFESSKSQIEYFGVVLLPLPDPPQLPLPLPPTQPDDNPYAGIAGLVIIVVIIAGIVIGIRGARKKKSIQYASPAAPTGGSGQQQTWQQAPPKKKRKIGIIKPKPKVQPQGIDDYSGLDLDPLYCANVACRSEHLKTKANGQKYCTKCGWNK